MDTSDGDTAGRQVGQWSDQELIDQYRLVRADSETPHSAGPERVAGTRITR